MCLQWLYQEISILYIFRSWKIRLKCVFSTFFLKNLPTLGTQCISHPRISTQKCPNSIRWILKIWKFDLVTRFRRGTNFGLFKLVKNPCEFRELVWMFRRSSSKPLNLSFTTERIPTESAKEETVTRAFERAAVYGRCFIEVEEFQLGNSLFRAIFYLNETTSSEPSTCEHSIRIVVGRLDKCPFCDKDCA